jgi:hypothetical protein
MNYCVLIPVVENKEFYSNFRHVYGNLRHGIPYTSAEFLLIPYFIRNVFGSAFPSNFMASKILVIFTDGCAQPLSGSGHEGACLLVPDLELLPGMVLAHVAAHGGIEGFAVALGVQDDFDQFAYLLVFYLECHRLCDLGKGWVPYNPIVPLPYLHNFCCERTVMRLYLLNF